MTAMLGVIAVAAFGAIIGSFLNVAIFRLPRGLSVSNPRWSFCPRCQARIRPRHNIPILSWLMLRGRCASCRAPVSAIYPVIEAMTAMTFLLVWDALFVSRLHDGVVEFSQDWALAVAWYCLFACLIAIAAMDIESYMIDVRPLCLAMIVGVVAHAIWWTVRGGEMAAPFLTGDDGSAGYQASVVPRALPRNAIDVLPPAVCLSVCAGGLVWCATELLIRRFGGKPNAPVEPESDGDESAKEDLSAYLSGGAGGFRPLPVLALVLILTLLIVSQLVGDETKGMMVVGGAWRGIVGCTVLMAVIVIGSLDPREADQQIIDEIEAEKPQARKTAVREFAYFVPTITVTIGLLVYFGVTKRLDTPLVGLLGATGEATWPATLGGAMYSITGLVLAAGIGWGVRIGGTMLFGKEAFGSGDIFILAAIGACMGFWAAFFAFFLSVFLALVGVVLTLFSRRARAIPFGPWLALGALAYLFAGPALKAHFSPAVQAIWSLVVR